MVKKALLLLAATSFFGVTYAQRCYTDEMNQQLKKTYPQIAVTEAQFKAELDARLGKMDLSKFKTTAPGDTAFSDVETLHVPVVFHVIHDYGSEYASDNDIYEAVKSVNALYNGTHPQVNQVIPPFKGNIPGTTIKYIAKTNIKFVLPTKDPFGNPTHGIVRKHSYLAYFGGNQAKMDIWPPDSYINIWVVRNFGGDVGPNVAAYALQPPAAASIPWYDGVITITQGGDINSDNTLGHELGHSLALNHPWNQSQSDPALICGDDDVDDTPPTKGHNNCSVASLYDSACATGYMKVYSPTLAYNLFGITSSTAVTINYPDTANTQNLMDYAHCSRMLTYLQGVRMRAALRSPIAGRSNLVSPTNLAYVGAFAPWPDLPPIADFSIAKNLPSSGGGPKVFMCPGNIFTFTNRSWNDTITSVQWAMSHGGSSATISPTQNATTSFTTPGWASVSVTATSVNTGSNTFTNPRAVYIADPNPTGPNGYFQEFDNGAEPANYPMFNHFNNDSRWEVVENAGFYDTKSLRYKNYDNRMNSTLLSGTPVGDYDDFFTPAFDFSSSSSSLKLNFFTSGAFRTTLSSEMNDTLEIRYSTDCGTSWAVLANLSKLDIANKGVQLHDYTPAGFWDWQGRSIQLPSAVIGKDKVFFRFRYKTFAGSVDKMGKSNNFYLDRIYFSEFTTDVKDLENMQSGITLAPNPTTGSSSVMIKDVNGYSAQVQVTDITGKVVYSTQATLSNGIITRVEIPANAIAVKGMYLVKVITGSSKHTEKLVVY
jgi:hypothetical protein